jgi:hypothetical protein
MIWVIGIFVVAVATWVIFLAGWWAAAVVASAPDEYFWASIFILSLWLLWRIMGWPVSRRDLQSRDYKPR